MVLIAQPSERSLTQALRQVVERGFGLEDLHPALVERNPGLPVDCLDPRLIPIPLLVSRPELTSVVAPMRSGWA